jgi:hypothetical protein
MLSGSLVASRDFFRPLRRRCGGDDGGTGVGHAARADRRRAGAPGTAYNRVAAARSQTGRCCAEASPRRSAVLTHLVHSKHLTGCNPIHQCLPYRTCPVESIWNPCRASLTAMERQLLGHCRDAANALSRVPHIRLAAADHWTYVCEQCSGLAGLTTGQPSGWTVYAGPVGISPATSLRSVSHTERASITNQG